MDRLSEFYILREWNVMTGVKKESVQNLFVWNASCEKDFIAAIFHTDAESSLKNYF